MLLSRLSRFTLNGEIWDHRHGLWKGYIRDYDELSIDHHKYPTVEYTQADKLPGK